MRVVGLVEMEMAMAMEMAMELEVELEVELVEDCLVALLEWEEVRFEARQWLHHLR